MERKEVGIKGFFWSTLDSMEPCLLFPPSTRGCRDEDDAFDRWWDLISPTALQNNVVPCAKKSSVLS